MIGRAVRRTVLAAPVTPRLLDLTSRARARLGAPGRAFIVYYHRVSDRPSCFDLAVPPALFERQLELLRRRARVVGMAELAARLAEPGPLVGDWAAVTFDDGYRDNLTAAEPVLARLGVPATVFVTTGFVDRRRVPTWDRLEHALRGLWSEGVEPAAWPAVGAEPIDRLVRRALAVPRDRDAPAVLHHALAGAGDGLAEEVLGRLELAGGGQPPAESAFLTWDEVRRLAERGIEIGAHGVSHRPMSRMDEDEAAAEAAASRRRIEEETGRPVAGFAFPFGDHAPATVRAVARSGFAYAVTTVRGANRPGDDRHRLRRVPPGIVTVRELDLRLALGGRSLRREREW